MLYEPSLRPETDRFVITAGATERHRAPRNVTWTKHYLERTDITEHPINVLLKHLSTLEGPIPYQNNESSRREQDALQASNLCYYALTRMADIKIQWVENVCEHLEFNQRKKVLKIFCFPSFCAMMCSGNAELTFLDRLFDECLPESATAIRSDYSSKDSCRAYRKAHGTKLSKEQHEEHWDPLRHILCANDWSNVPVYSELDAPNIRALYLAQSNFRFFAERLINLQQHITTPSSNDWKALWRDRRDVARFWALWAVIDFSNTTIFSVLFRWD